MINFLHTNLPQAVLIKIGPFSVHWYGLLIALGLIIGTQLILFLAKQYREDKQIYVDLIFGLMLWGIIGARLYDVIIEYEYYFDNIKEIFMIWHGGLAIHGGLIGGGLYLFYFSRRHNKNFWFLGALLVPALALAQTIGRFGNYFNQELYGRPTNLPWGIPIAASHRLPELSAFTYFHPTFLYESFGNFIIFIILLILHKKIKIHHRQKFRFIVFVYFFSYSLLRFSLEWVRVDPTWQILGWRWPQIVSLGVFLSSAWFWKKELITGARLANTKIKFLIDRDW